MGRVVVFGTWLLVILGVSSREISITNGAETSADPNPDIARAMQALKANAERADADPTRPVYHYRPLSGWISDPDGPIYRKGFYHTFYIHNPFSGRGWPHSRNHWGHARSRDLVFWEHLPIALAPLFDREHRCNSGCLAINGRGRPLIFYTHVPLKQGANEQWAAEGDDDLITWRRVPENPILAYRAHGEPKFHKSWRDPFIFKTDGRTFLILTARLDGNAVVPIYEAVDPELLDWKYRGIMFTIPKEISCSLECPNFLRLGAKWVLIGSALDKSYAVRYFVGSFNAKTLRFSSEGQGLVDHLDNFLYATNVLHDDRGQSILLARVKHFKPDRAWNGCLALPRILSLDSRNRLIQQPVPRLKQLRRQHFGLADIMLDSGEHVVKGASGDCLEIAATFELGSAKVFGLNLRRSPDDKRGVMVRYDGREFSFGEYVDGKLTPCRHHSDRPDAPGGKLPFSLPEEENVLTLHVFLDKSVMEVFVNNGQACATRVIYPGENDLGISLFAEEGNVTARSLDVWQMQSIWKPTAIQSE